MEGTIGDDGSSPLVRGQHRLVREQHHRIRIIPARAGPTPCSPTARTPATDHPRSCGANCGGYGGDDACDGSSPLVRGQPVNRSHCPFWSRIIPARAGPTLPSKSEVGTATDHPRSCGANRSPSASFAGTRGSSPLVRGQHSCDPTPSSPLRIIPARAGPTRGGRPHCNCGTDHPRSCGANFGLMYVAVPVTGSSPLVRGQPATDNVAAGDVRIIPARAGPTYITVDFDRASTDHPRSCGANVLSRLRWRGHFGSSPLVRGQLVLQLQRQRHARIIPARAGPTFLRGCKYPIYADHPRSCGANPVSFDVIPVSQRIIPARAGPTVHVV